MSTMHALLHHPFQLDPPEREAAGIPHLDAEWDAVEIEPGTWFVFEGDVLRRLVTADEHHYEEIEYDLVTADRAMIPARTPTGADKPCTPRGLPPRSRRRRFRSTAAGVQVDGPAPAARPRIRYREGDVFAVPLGDGEWAHARILFDLYHRRIAGEFDDQRLPAFWRLMGQAILVQPYAAVGRERALRARSLAVTPVLPADWMHDDLVLRGQYAVVAHHPVDADCVVGLPLHLFVDSERRFAHLQRGTEARHLPYADYRRLLEEEGVDRERSGSPFAANGVGGYALDAATMRACAAATDDAQRADAWFTRPYGWPADDLRSPQNRALRETVLAAFGLATEPETLRALPPVDPGDLELIWKHHRLPLAFGQHLDEALELLEIVHGFAIAREDDPQHDRIDLTLVARGVVLRFAAERLDRIALHLENAPALAGVFEGETDRLPRSLLDDPTEAALAAALDAHGASAPASSSAVDHGDGALRVRVERGEGRSSLVIDDGRGAR